LPFFGNSCLKFVGKLFWRHTAVSLENLAEMALIVKTEFRRNLGNRGLAGYEQILRRRNPCPKEVLVRTEAGALFKQAAEMKGTESRSLSNLP
jgi:hypothetical protein